MEIHPILERDVVPTHNLWYVVSAVGDCPSMRVGHTAVFKKASEGQDQVIFIGGANPSETFSDIHLLGLQTLSWNLMSPAGFNARYEHAAFSPLSYPNRIYILCGANQEGNLSDVQYYDLTGDSWSTVKPSGSAPTARTHHTTAAVDDCLYVFSGGKSGAEPTQDRQVYCYNAVQNSWSSPAINGESPAPRHGHTLSVYGSKLICFGGMANSKLYNDVHVLDLDKLNWSSPKVKKRNQPCPRASHSACISGKSMYVFGGMNKEGMALDDLWVLDLVSMQWTLLSSEGPSPSSRLDMASCVITWNWEAGQSSDSSAVDQAAASSEGEREDSRSAEGHESCSAAASNASSCQLLLIHGGMDTQGEIFDDCLVFRLD